jgi:hypothetical protein
MAWFEISELQKTTRDGTVSPVCLGIGGLNVCKRACLGQHTLHAAKMHYEWRMESIYGNFSHKFE